MAESRMVPPDEARRLLDETTPGPWSTDHDWAAISAGSDSVVHGYVNSTCDACGAEVNDDAEVAISAEDAALIAAAPDLAHTAAVLGEQRAAAKGLLESWLRQRDQYKALGVEWAPSPSSLDALARALGGE